MKKINKYIRLMITSHSGISSKRICGVFGFLIVTFTLVYCTICGIQAPLMIETFNWTVCALLGIDSIMSPFRKKKKK